MWAEWAGQMPGLGPTCKWGMAGEPWGAPLLRVGPQPPLPHSCVCQAGSRITDSQVSTLSDRSAVRWGDLCPAISCAMAAVGRGVGWCGPLPWAMVWFPLAWPLCRCHSDSCGSIGAWQCCPEGRAPRLTGQGQGTSSSWWGCRERGMRSERTDTPTLWHQSLRA